jgi:hypothetical protein
MFAESARRIFDILERPDAPRGVITAEQLPDAIARLTRAVEEDKAQAKAMAAAQDEAERRGDPLPRSGQGISLAQRAYPLLEMLRAAQKRNVEVTWGV